MPDDEEFLAPTPADRVLGFDDAGEAEGGDEPVAGSGGEPRYDTPIQRARRIGGVPGAMLAGAMLAIRDLFEGPPKNDMVAVVESPTEPHDVDRDGVRLSVGGVDVAAPALPRAAPVAPSRRSKLRKRRGGRGGGSGRR